MLSLPHRRPGERASPATRHVRAGGGLGGRRRSLTRCEGGRGLAATAAVVGAAEAVVGDAALGHPEPEVRSVVE